ncbi:hypothetical protein ACSBR2_034231 [Camellia fascicularis]|uniref:Uncharacterized protein n=1 Tax=Camellia sinensis TaxID=4442 RepID=A0A7J7GL02_CAMSI|nr:hypothetical protein HYC85_022334 [Camellia sinensis]
MAGLQYKFFPTDFFFPPQRSITRDGATQNLLPIRNNEKIEDRDASKALIHREINDKRLKSLPSSSLPLSPIIINPKQENQDGSM